MKASDAGHYVQRFTFDVQVGRKQDAKPVQDRLSAIFNNRLERMLERLLDELDDPSYIIKLNTIEIDLGEIKEDSLESDLYYKLKTALEKEIGKRVRLIRGSPIIDPDIGTKVPLAPAKIDLLAYFLEYGRMPSGGEMFKSSIEEIFREMVTRSPDQMVALLHRVLPEKPVAARRIVRQFRRSTLEELVQIAAPSHVFFLRSQETEMVRLIPGLTGHSPSRVREENRIALLKYLFSEPEPRFETPTYREEMRKALTKELGSPVAQIFPATDESEDAPKRSVPGREIGRMRAVVTKALRSGPEAVNSARLIEAWEFLVRQAPEELRQTIGRSSPDAAPIAQMMENIPVAAVRLFVRNVLAQTADQVFEVAVAVISEFVALRSENTADENFVRQVYAAILYRISTGEQSTSAPEKIAEAIRQHLATVDEVPAELLAGWSTWGIPGAGPPVALAEEEAAGIASVAPPRDGEDLPPPPRIAQAEEETEAPSTPATEEKETRREPSPLTPEEQEKHTQALKSAIQAEEERRREAARKAREEAEAVPVDPEYFPPEEDAVESRPISEREESPRRPADPEIPDARPLENRVPRMPDLPPAEEEEDIFRRQRPIKPPDPAEMTELFSLGTEEGRIEYVMYFLRYGESPWWVENLRQRDIQALVTRLVKAEPEKLSAGFEELIYRSQPALYPAIANRLILELDAVTRLRVLELVMPDLVGFVGTMARALSLYWDQHRAKLSPTPRLATAPTFAWNLPLQYVFRYFSSRTSARSLVQFVVKEVAAAVQKPVATFIEEFKEVAEAAVEKGERRFAPLLTLLPEPEDTLQLDAPLPHPGAPEIPATMRSPAAEALSPETAEDAPLPQSEGRAEQGPMIAEEEHTADARHREEEPADSPVVDPEALGTREEAERIEADRRRAREAAEAPPETEAEAAEEEVESLAPAAELADKEEEADRRRTEREVEAQVGEDVPRTEEEAEALRHRAEQDATELAVESAALLPEAEGEVEVPLPEPRDPEAKDPEAPEALPAEELSDDPAVLELSAEEVAEARTTAEAEMEDAEGVAEPQRSEGGEGDLPEEEAEPRQRERLRDDEPVAMEDLSPKERLARRMRGQKIESPDEALARIEAERQEYERQMLAEEGFVELPPVISLEGALEDEAESIRIVEYYLRFGALPHQDLGTVSAEEFREFFREVIRKHGRAFTQMLRQQSGNRQVRLRLVRLGEAVGVESVLRLNWVIGSPMRSFLESVLELVRQSGSPVEAEPVLEHAIQYVLGVTGSAFKAVNYVRALFRYLERYYQVERLELVRFLIEKNAERSVPVKAVLTEILELMRIAAQRQQNREEPKVRQPVKPSERTLPADSEIFVENAGVVLVWPFMERFFQLLNLLNEEREFKDEEAQEKAAHMLQYLAAKEVGAPEEKLFLNKLLVGLPLDYPMNAEVEITEEEKETTESLLRAVVEQWNMMKGAPPDQLRATFLIRNGVLKQDQERNWALQVEKRGLDIILKQLPWALGQVRVPWLVDYKIEIEWG
ncbi:MAG: contractile injection system tape measure protein [Bacteroidota bacterium]